MFVGEPRRHVILLNRVLRCALFLELRYVRACGKCPATFARNDHDADRIICLKIRHNLCDALPHLVRDSVMFFGSVKTEIADPVPLVGENQICDAGCRSVHTTCSFRIISISSSENPNSRKTLVRVFTDFGCRAIRHLWCAAHIRCVTQHLHPTERRVIHGARHFEVSSCVGSDHISSIL